MEYLITLYNLFMDWLEKYEKEVAWFVLGATTVLVTVLLLTAHWIVALIYGSLTFLNLYATLKSKK